MSQTLEKDLFGLMCVCVCECVCACNSIFGWRVFTLNHHFEETSASLGHFLLFSLKEQFASKKCKFAH